MNRTLRSGLMIITLTALLLAGTACAPDPGILLPTASQVSQPSATATTANPAAQLHGKIVASGSTSMEELMVALGEAFSARYPDVAVEVQGGGSSTGVKNANTGVTEIGSASRALKPEEKTFGLNEHIIAIDGIVVAVNAANPVKALTTAQLVSIFTKKIKNWQEVGGVNAPIVVVLREAGSGTRDGFESILNIVDKCVGDQEVNETGVVKSTVAGNANAIGYLSLGKLDGTVHAVAVDGVMPTEATVQDKTYKIQRPFLSLTKGTESVLVKAFYDFIFSPDGQAMVQAKGFVKIQ
jgi:phosphate transport system substrate-binding protein